MRIQDEPSGGSLQTVEFRESHARVSKCDWTAVSVSTVELNGNARKTIAGCVERIKQL
jgi:hypothetical protein